MSKFLKNAIEIVVYIAVIVLVVYAAPKVLSKALDTEYPMAAISSGSMWPALKQGDLVLIKGAQKEDIKIGDIIVYQNSPSASSGQAPGFTIHRVVKLNDNTLVTKGDANTVEDAPVSYDKIIGKTVTFKNKSLRIPYLGKITALAQKK